MFEAEETPGQAAAAWYARRSGASLGRREQAAFDAWLAADPANARAYARVEGALSSFSALAGDPALAALRAETSAHVRGARRSRRALRLALAGGLAAAAALAAFVGVWMFQVQRLTLQTGPGELRQVALSDGTRAWLGSDTRLEVAYARSRRSVAVQHGEAFFDVAKNKHRPFVVSARDRTVTALGTAFDVRVFEPDIIVTLVRGSVGIGRLPADGAGEARLKPGQQYWLKGGVAVVRDVDAEAQVSWRQGLIELDDTSLSEAVSTFNHNSKAKLLIGDDRLSELRVSGVFHAGKVEDFAHALEVEHPVVAVRQSSGDILLRYR